MPSLSCRVLLLSILPLFSEQRLEDTNVQVLFKWKHPEWLYPSEGARQTAEEQGLFVPQNGAILDSDFYFTHLTSLRRMFVSTPPFRSGIPTTLSEVTRLHDGHGSFLLKPFPDWSAKNRSSCEGPISVYRFYIDKCGLLWALDTGRVDTFTENDTRICRPKIVVYDLNNRDAVILRHEFPDSLLTDQSTLISIITESYKSDCRDSIAYVADTNAYALIVFDMAQKTSWKVNSPYFHPFPNKAAMFSNGVTFELMDGIFGITLGSHHDVERKLYFHSFASVREGWIPVSVLKNKSLASNAAELRKRMIISEDARPSQSTLEVMTEDGILIYALISRNAIACWNSKTKFRPENQFIIYEDDENLQFISGMKLKGKQLLLTSSRLQNYINGDLKRNDVKYRMILIDDVNELLINTPCTKPPPIFHSNPLPYYGPRPMPMTPYFTGLKAESATWPHLDEHVKITDDFPAIKHKKNYTSSTATPFKQNEETKSSLLKISQQSENTVKENISLPVVDECDVC